MHRIVHHGVNNANYCLNVTKLDSLHRLSHRLSVMISTSDAGPTKQSQY
jgi:hypothetical protein